MRLPGRCLSLFLAVLLTALSLPLAVSAAGIIYQGVGFVTMDKQCLYTSYNARSKVLAEACENDCVLIVKEVNDYWYQVVFNGTGGYMYADCLDVRTEADVELGLGQITGQTVYLRSGPGQQYSLESSGFQYNKHEIIGFQDGWFKILKDNKTCYIRSDLMKLTEIPYQNAGAAQQPKFYYAGVQIGELTFEETEAQVVYPIYSDAGDGSGGDSGHAYLPHLNKGTLLANAAQFVGVPYVYGGTSPSGFDCSGLVYYSLSLMGISAPRSAAGQYSLGYGVDRSSLAAGDLVFFSSDGSSITHVGIYAGGGSFLHAPHEGAAVCYSSLSGYWSDHFYGARRL